MNCLEANLKSHLSKASITIKSFFVPATQTIFPGTFVSRWSIEFKGCVALRLVICLFACGICVAQKDNGEAKVQATPTRNANAISALTTAISALGGQSSWQKLQSIVVQGTLQQSNSSSTQQIRWIDDLSKPFPEFRRETVINGNTVVWISGHGKSAYSNGTSTHSVPTHAMLANLPYYLPAIVLMREIADAQYSIEWIGNETLNGNPVVHVRCSRRNDRVNASVTPQNWYFDATTLLPIRVEFRVPNFANALKTFKGSIDYSGWHNESGLLTPTILTSSRSAGTSITITLNSYSLNSTITSSDFELSGGTQ